MTVIRRGAHRYRPHTPYCSSSFYLPSCPLNLPPPPSVPFPYRLTLPYYLPTLATRPRPATSYLLLPLSTFIRATSVNLFLLFPFHTVVMPSLLSPFIPKPCLPTSFLSSSFAPSVCLLRLLLLFLIYAFCHHIPFLSLHSLPLTTFPFHTSYVTPYFFFTFPFPLLQSASFSSFPFFKSPHSTVIPVIPYTLTPVFHLETASYVAPCLHIPPFLPPRPSPYPPLTCPFIIR